MDIKININRVPIRYKIKLIVILVIILFSLIVNLLIIPQLKQEKLDERKGKLRAVVNSVVSLLNFYELSVRNQTNQRISFIPKNRNDAQALVLKNIREMRYDKNEYFFILDGNGTVVMHPLKKELEGENLLKVKDRSGAFPFKDIVYNAQRDSETFVSFLWQSKYSKTVYENQTVYAKYFWKWDWIVCSGVYTEDINESIKKITIVSSIIIVITTLVVVGILFVFLYFNFSKPFSKILQAIEHIKKRNYDFKINISSNDEFGEISSQLTNMATDIKKQREEIVASQRKYKELSEMLPDMIYEIDADLNILYVNNACTKILGYTYDDVNNGLSLKDIIEGKDYIKLKERILERHSVDDDKFFNTYKMRRKDGEYIIGENNTVLVYENDVLTSVRGIIRDVTEKVRLQEKLVQSQKMDTVGTLAGGLAHDFNNVLSGVVATLSLLKYKMVDFQTLTKKDIEEYIETMENSSERAVDMVQQLLALSRKQDLDFVPIDLNIALKDVMEICSNTFDKAVELKFNYYKEEATANADLTQVEQVLLNLCVNAMHSMTIMRESDQNYGGELNVSLTMVMVTEELRKKFPRAKLKKYWRIEVTDTGVGINNRIIGKIFDPFFTTKDKGEGTGLGLAMVFNIIDLHNGFIDVSSQLNVGSKFSIYLPVYTEGEELQRRTEEPKKIYKGKGTILVIDDEEVMQYVATNILQECGYEVISAYNGEDGIALYRTYKDEIDVVVLDLIMPKKNGKDTYIGLKKINKNVKVILASGFIKDSRVTDLIDLGVEKFVSKPYTIEKLSLVVHELLPGKENKNEKHNEKHNDKHKEK